MKKLFLLSVISCGIFLYACNGSDNEKSTTATTATTTTVDTTASAPAAASTAVDPSQPTDSKGLGKFKHVDVPPNLDLSMAEAGGKIAQMKCLSCHKVSGEKLVGPGWEGVTKRRTPEWIMNFVTNTDEMLSKDPQAQANLEICLVRMPNQNLKDDEARQVLEFMRKNDGVK